MRILFFSAVTVLFFGLGPGDHDCRAFELQDGDRVVLVGGGLIERAQRYGAIETRITAALPERRIVFRNLGWSGDTVFGHSRAPGRTGSIFGTPEQGFRNLIQQVRDSQPTVLIVGYGFNESFAGPEGLDAFRDATVRLFDALQEVTKRILVLSPPPQFSPPSGDLDVDSRNDVIAEYGNVLRSEADARGFVYVDCLPKLNERPLGSHYGMHLSPAGYEVVSSEVAAAFGIGPGDGAVGLPADRVEQLRQMIVAKNRLFLHSWRPRNTAFISGERKDEQVPSHFDVPKFLPLVENAEREIHSFTR